VYNWLLAVALKTAFSGFELGACRANSSGNLGVHNGVFYAHGIILTIKSDNGKNFQAFPHRRKG